MQLVLVFGWTREFGTHSDSFACSSIPKLEIILTYFLRPVIRIYVSAHSLSTVIYRFSFLIIGVFISFLALIAFIPTNDTSIWFTITSCLENNLWRSDITPNHTPLVALLVRDKLKRSSEAFDKLCVSKLEGSFWLCYFVHQLLSMSLLHPSLLENFSLQF